MSIYTTIQYIKYRLKAKTRHGVHSPFVYGFIEQVLQQKGDPDSIPLTVKGAVSLLHDRYRCLLTNINSYCQPTTLQIISVTDAAQLNIKMSILNSDDLVVVTGIHSSPVDTAEWTQLHSNTHVKLSIDIYGVGLLFFKKEFKEKQHFVLKY